MSATLIEAAVVKIVEYTDDWSPDYGNREDGVRHILRELISASAKSGQASNPALTALREIEAYHVALISKRQKRNDPEKSWTVRVAREGIAAAEEAAR